MYRNKPFGFSACMVGQAVSILDHPESKRLSGFLAGVELLLKWASAGTRAGCMNCGIQDMKIIIIFKMFGCISYYKLINLK